MEVIILTALLFIGANAASSLRHKREIEAPDGGCAEFDIDTFKSKLTAEQKNQSLELHNHYRSAENATNEFRLIWDDELAARAQQWSDQCQWKHGMTFGCDEDSTVLGQNLYFVSGSGGFPGLNVGAAMKAWADEKVFYHLDSKTCDDGKMCGHYTQVVWAETTHVGCGVTQCETLTSSDGKVYKNAVVFSCDYSPAGNWQHVAPFTRGVTCSACKELIGGKAGWMCDDEGLCSPCQPKDYADDDKKTCNCDNKADKCQNGGTFDAEHCTCRCTSEYFGSYCENYCAINDAAGYEGACPQWRDAGYCTSATYKAFMEKNCPKSCGTGKLPASCNA